MAEHISFDGYEWEQNPVLTYSYSRTERIGDRETIYTYYPHERRIVFQQDTFPDRSRLLDFRNTNYAANGYAKLGDRMVSLYEVPERDTTYCTIYFDRNDLKASVRISNENLSSISFSFSPNPELQEQIKNDEVGTDPAYLLRQLGHIYETGSDSFLSQIDESESTLMSSIGSEIGPELSDYDELAPQRSAFQLKYRHRVSDYVRKHGGSQLNFFTSQALEAEILDRFWFDYDEKQDAQLQDDTELYALLTNYVRNVIQIHRETIARSGNFTVYLYPDTISEDPEILHARVFTNGDAQIQDISQGSGNDAVIDFAGEYTFHYRRVDTNAYLEVETIEDKFTIVMPTEIDFRALTDVLASDDWRSLMDLIQIESHE